MISATHLHMASYKHENWLIFLWDLDGVAHLLLHLLLHCARLKPALGLDRRRREVGVGQGLGGRDCGAKEIGNDGKEEEDEHGCPACR